MNSGGVVKVITGIRRCGKSSLLKLMVQHLKDIGIQPEQIIEMNFESFDFRGMSADDIYRYVKERIVLGKRMYLFFDELQRIEAWEDAINAFRVDFDCDIYVTGSNAYLLSSEYSTYLSGRCVEIKMLPLSFREFLDFHGFEVRETQSALGGLRRQAFDRNGERYALREVFDAYMRFGEDGLTIGKAGNPLTFRVVNDRLAFYMNDTEVAYLSDNKLYVTQAEILARLQIGKFAYEPQSNGNLSVIYTG